MRHSGSPVNKKITVRQRHLSTEESANVTIRHVAKDFDLRKILLQSILDAIESPGPEKLRLLTYLLDQDCREIKMTIQQLITATKISRQTIIDTLQALDSYGLTTRDNGTIKLASTLAFNIDFSKLTALTVTHYYEQLEQADCPVRSKHRRIEDESEDKDECPKVGKWRQLKEESERPKKIEDGDKPPQQSQLRRRPRVVEDDDDD
jgi:hypothetical protein